MKSWTVMARVGWRFRIEREHRERLIMSCYTPASAAPTASSRRGVAAAPYAKAATELLPHVARGLNIDWGEATRYAGLANFDSSRD